MKTQYLPAVVPPPAIPQVNAYRMLLLILGLCMEGVGCSAPQADTQPSQSAPVSQPAEPPTPSSVPSSQPGRDGVPALEKQLDAATAKAADEDGKDGPAKSLSDACKRRAPPGTRASRCLDDLDKPIDPNEF
jgi:hypothetical protein